MTELNLPRLPWGREQLEPKPTDYLTLEIWCELSQDSWMYRLFEWATGHDYPGVVTVSFPLIHDISILHILAHLRFISSFWSTSSASGLLMG